MLPSQALRVDGGRASVSVRSGERDVVDARAKRESIVVAARDSGAVKRVRPPPREPWVSVDLRICE